MRKIAILVTKKSECDTLLKLTELQLSNRDSVIGFKDRQLVLMDKVVLAKDSIILHKEAVNLQLEKTVKKKELSIKWIKYGWLSTTALLGGLLIYKLF